MMFATTQIAWALSVVGAMAVGVIGTRLVTDKPIEPPKPQAPIISLEKMGDLVSIKVNYADVIEFDQKRTLNIPWTDWGVSIGGTKVLLVARGDCSIATNLSAARYENISEKHRTLKLVLPGPRTLQARVKHSDMKSGGSYFYAVTSKGVEPIIPGDANRTKAINNALQVAQREVERSCATQPVIALAKKNAEEVLTATFQATGWAPTIVWQ
jgi:hypothetical protein